MAKTNQYKLMKILEFQKENPDYLIRKVIDKLSDGSYPFKNGGDFIHASGINHYVRFLIAPKKGIYSIPELNKFMNYFEKQIGIECVEDLAITHQHFSIKTNKKLFLKEGEFLRGDLVINEPLDIEIRRKRQVFLDVNYDCFTESKQKELKNLLSSLDKDPETNTYFRNIEYSLRPDEISRSIALRFFPDKYMMHKTQISEHADFPKYNHKKLEELIGIENSNSIFGWVK